MSEMAQALKAFGNIKKSFIIQYPSGKYGFVGRVPAMLAYIKEDGTEPTQEELQAVADHGSYAMRAYKITTRAYDTREDAERALRAVTL